MIKERNKLALEYANQTVLTPFNDYISTLSLKNNDINILKVNTISDIFNINSNYQNTPIFLAIPDISNLTLSVKKCGNFTNLDYLIRYIINDVAEEINNFSLLITVVDGKIYYWNIDIEVLEVLIKEFENDKVKEITNIIKKFLV